MLLHHIDKDVCVLQHNNWAKDFASGDSWVWWILVICGKHLLSVFNVYHSGGLFYFYLF